MTHDRLTDPRTRWNLLSWLLHLEQVTRPVGPETRAALTRRWSELPEHVHTPAQTLGRVGIGCEGTHGVFPRCNFACRPCYHSRDANHVRVDGPHTVSEVSSQMALLRSLRAPHAHAQLIGGEVSLLDPDDHAQTLLAMRQHGREPMSFTHGDFDYRYLEHLALGSDGQPRFSRLSFAGHFDTTMVGRQGLRRTANEADLDPFRRRFCDMFLRLRKKHGVRFFLAHNMTITPGNVDQIPGVISRCHAMGFNMFSFQPAAHVGDERRWTEEYKALDPDAVWQRIEEGSGSRLPYHLFEVGDTRCNRTAWGFYLEDRWYSILDDTDPRDIAVRDAYLRDCGGVHFNAPLRLLVPRLLRLAVTHPRLVPLALGWLRRTVHRIGGPLQLMRHRVVPMTFVMHRFMHAEDVAPAWAMLERGEMSDEPRLRETQERLQACSYAMAHPETGRVVPACVQHGVLDPEENRELIRLLPIPRRRQPSEAQTTSAP
jgi:hypothetical protein